MPHHAEQNNRAWIFKRQFRSRIAVLLVFLWNCALPVFCGCQFPYKIDPSGDCLFVKNEDYALPEQNSPFVSQTGTRPTETAPAGMTTVPAATDPAYQASVPGVTAAPGVASGVAPSSTAASGTGIIRGNNSGTLLVPGSGPIVLVAPEEQIALIGTEVILFANYKGDDDYLRIGERIEWSLGGVGHVQTTNKTQCSNILALDFNKDKKMSDRYAVTSTLHYEGTIDRGSADEQGQVPHLAGQSWISIRSAEEGTSTVTAYAPTIKDWNRRTSSGVVHWIDAEWVYPRADITKYDEPKVFVTKVKKRSSGSPCPGWVVRYEIAGGPSAGLGPNRLNSLDVVVNESGDAAVDLYLLEGDSGTSTVKATVIRPAGVEGGTKRLELHSATLTNIWSTESPLSLHTISPNRMQWSEPSSWTIYGDNPSSVDKPGVITLPLPPHVKLISSVPTPTNVTQQSDGGELATWEVEFRARQRAEIKLVLQAVTDDPALKSQQLDVELIPELTMFPRRDSAGQNGQSGQSGLGTGIAGGVDYGLGTGASTLPSYTPDALTGSNPWSNSGMTPPGGRPGGGYGGPGMTTPNDGVGGTNPGAANNTGHCDPSYFANKLKVECKPGATMPVNKSHYIEVVITNNADIPFHQGQVRVNLSNNLVFLDGNNAPVVGEDGNYRREQYYYIGSAAVEQVAIPAGQSHRMEIPIAAIQEGQSKIEVSAMGRFQYSETMTEISGASETKSLRAMQ